METIAISEKIHTRARALEAQAVIEAEVFLEALPKVAFVPEPAKGLTFLEQLTVFQVRCSNPKVPYLYHVCQETGLVTFARGACKMWSCPECAMRNAKRWIARIIDGINKLPKADWYFATVTAHKWWRGEKSLINLRSNWHKLRKRMSRLAKKLGIELAYARVWEHHKDGSYHLHLIVNLPVTRKWLKDNAAKCGMGYQAHLDEVINAGQAAGYVAKYMLKQSQADTLHSFPKGARRIEVSANWVKWHEKKQEDWHYSGNVDDASRKSTNMKRHGVKVNDLAIKNEKKRLEKKYNDYRRTEDESSRNGHASTGKLDANTSPRKERVERPHGGQQKELRTKQLAKGANKSSSTRVDQSTIKDGRILENERPTSKSDLQQFDRAKSHSRKTGNNADDPLRETRRDNNCTRFSTGSSRRT